MNAVVAGLARNFACFGGAGFRGFFGQIAIPLFSVSPMYIRSFSNKKKMVQT